MCLCSTSLVISELTRSRTVRDAEGREVVAVMTAMGRLGEAEREWGEGLLAPAFVFRMTFPRLSGLVLGALCEDRTLFLFVDCQYTPLFTYEWKLCRDRLPVYCSSIMTEHVMTFFFRLCTVLQLWKLCLGIQAWRALATLSRVLVCLRYYYAWGAGTF